MCELFSETFCHSALKYIYFELFSSKVIITAELAGNRCALVSIQLTYMKMVRVCLLQCNNTNKY